MAFTSLVLLTIASQTLSPDEVIRNFMNDICTGNGESAAAYCAQSSLYALTHTLEVLQADTTGCQIDIFRSYFGCDITEQELAEISVEEFLGLILSSEHSSAYIRETDVFFGETWIRGDSAFVSIAYSAEGELSTDTLAFVKEGGEWKIVVEF